MPDPTVPDILPVLSRGKHRNARKGACFMELASFLAGERWSDHPSCTHPLLAALARHVNDRTSDAHRAELAPLIPSVIGLTSDDLHVDARIALRAARTALPVVAEECQRVMAVSVLACENVLTRLDGRAPGSLEEESRAALAAAPLAARWADHFSQQVDREVRVSARGFRRHAAPSAVGCAVEGIAQACVPDPDALLRGLLAGAVEDTSAWVARPPADVPADEWASAVQLTTR